ncbi:MAG: ATP-binding protein [Pseudomonadota bacterium]
MRNFPVLLFTCWLLSLISNRAAACVDLYDEQIVADPAALIAELEVEPLSFSRACGLGRAHARRGAHAEASSAFQEAVDLAGNDLAREAAARRELGVAYYFQVDMVAAKRELQRGLSAAKAAGDKTLSYQITNALGSVAMWSSDWAQADEYFSTALAGAEASREMASREEVATQLVRIYFNLASVKMEKGEHGRASELLSLGVDYAKEVDDQLALTNYLNLQGEVARRAGRLDEADAFYDQAIQRLETLPPGVYRLNILLGAMNTAFDRRDPDKLTAVLDRYKGEIAQMETVPSPFDAHVQSFQLRRAVLNDDREAAFAEIQDVIALYEAGFAEEKATALAELEATFEAERREAEISLLQQRSLLSEAQNTRLRLLAVGLGVIILLSALTGYFAWSRWEMHAALTRETARLDARVEERTRMAREIHDTLLQSFAATGVQTQLALKHVRADPAKSERLLKETLQQTDMAMRQAREAILEARTPAALDLSRALRTMLDTETKNRDIETSLDINGELSSLVPDKAVGFHRIAEEAVKNAVRHAEAKRISIRVDHDGANVTMRIKDNGCGFDPSQPAPGHFGLIGMRERAERRGGTLVVESAPGAGTTIIASLPAHSSIG